MNWAKAYTVAIGFAFLIIVGGTLAIDTLQNGVTLETAHKLTHVAVGAWAAVIVFQKRERQYSRFALFNGVFYGAFAVIGWTLPDFLGIDAFNRADTILHTIVAATGLVIGVKEFK